MDMDCDLLVIGSGAAGLAAAVTAAHHGLRVIVVEKSTTLGGTTAWSGGWIWAPCNPVAHRHGIVEDPSEPRRYLEAVLGNTFNAELADAFLQAAPEMVGFFEDNTTLAFDCGTKIPDTYSHQPGAGMGGRSVIAQPYDARDLGDAVNLLCKPMKETSFWGMTIQAGPDLRAFMTATRSVGSALHVARRLTRHVLELARFGRGMQLRNGNALVARLLRSALDLGVTLLPEHAASGLTIVKGTVVGATLSGPDGTVHVNAGRGVVLAAGGFPHDMTRRDQFPRSENHLSLALPHATGDGLRFGESAGGQQAKTLASPGAWCPVSRVPFADGTTGVFPHIIDRGKPGVIGVLASGRRFTNEGLGYHDYVRDMLDAVPDGMPAESWLLCDHRFIRRYGLGIVRPAPVPLGPWVKNGYVTRADTPEALAKACGIDAAGLVEAINTYNKGAQRGEDPAFGRGTTPLHASARRPGRDAQPLCRANRNRPVLRGQGRAGQLWHFCRTEDGWQRPRTWHGRHTNPRPLRGRHRHGERHGRAVSRGRHQSRPGTDLRVHRRSPRSKRHLIMRLLSLAHLTAIDLAPPDLIRAASEARFDAVGLRLLRVTPTTPGYPLWDDPAMLRETRAAISETGVQVHDIEFVRITPETDIETLQRFLDTGAELGAREIITAPYDPDHSRMADTLGRLSEASAERGMGVVLEFFPWTDIRTVDDALRLATQAGPRVGILPDSLHFDRSGSSLETLATLPPDRLRFAHLCDAPVLPAYDEATLLYAAREERLLPGKGRIDLAAYLRALPADLPLAIEVPRTTTMNAVGGAELIKETGEAVRTFLNSIFT